jgi:hypothetical protein
MPRERSRDWWLAAISATLWVSGSTSSAKAQLNLPPPPPPPLGEPADLPPAAVSAPPSGSPGRPSAGPALPRYPNPSAGPPPAAPPRYRAPRRRQAEVIYIEEPASRSVALTLNPLSLFLGRLSGNVEVLVAPHHSVVFGPNILVLQEGRGDRYNLVSEGLGYATRTSSGLGFELGYHYWWPWQRSLRGPFLGPSLLIGSTTNASVGDPSRAQAYWGAAFDVGDQEVLPGGFTIGGGFGLAVVKMTDALALFPRLLVQAGWSF